MPPDPTAGNSTVDPRDEFRPAGGGYVAGPYGLNPGQSQVRRLPLRHGWYDVPVTSDVVPGYLRRPAGNVEPGVSQP